MANLRKCKSCGAEIARKGKVVCPHCGQVHKKPLYTRWWFILIVFFLIVGAIGSLGDDPKAIAETQSNAGDKNDSGESNSTTESVQEERTEFFIGEHVSLKDVVVRVIGIADYIEKNEFLIPAEGFKRKQVEVEVYNIGESDYDLQSVFAFELKDSDGYNYTPNFYDTTNVVLTGSIPQGGKARGYVFFDVPVDSQITEILYDYQLFSSGQITFNLDESKSVLEDNYTNPVKLTKVELGQEMIGDGLVVNVNETRQAKLSSIDVIDSEGYAYLIADVTVKNTLSESKYISAYGSFYVVDTDGYRYPIAIYADGLKGTIDGDLHAGKESRAEIAFKVKQGATIDYLLYSAFMGVDNVSVTNLGVAIN